MVKQMLLAPLAFIIFTSFGYCDVVFGGASPYDAARSFSVEPNSASIGWGRVTGELTEQRLEGFLARFNSDLERIGVMFELHYTPDYEFNGSIFGFVDGWAIRQAPDMKLEAFLPRIAGARYLFDHQPTKSRIALANRISDEALFCPQRRDTESCWEQEAFSWRGTIATNGIRTISFVDLTTLRLSTCYHSAVGYIETELSKQAPELSKVGVSLDKLIREPDHRHQDLDCYRIYFDMALPDVKQDIEAEQLYIASERILSVFSSVGGKSLKAAIVDDMLK